MALRHAVAVCCALNFWPAAATLALPEGRREEAAGQSFCAAVQDVGAMGLIDIQVGSSKQKLNLVVDTGSNVLIVESCECQESHICPEAEACLNTTESKTLKYLQLPNGTDRTMTLNFGSGVINGQVAEDTVQVGTGNPVRMEDGMLLMLKRQLDFDDVFEGILGLGPSTPLIQQAMDDAMKQAEDDLEEMKERAKGADEAVKQVIKDAEHQMQEAKKDSTTQPQGFLEQAGFERFSLCFGKGDDSNGTLVVGGPPASAPVKSIGKLHWGVSIEEVRVGGKPVMYDPAAAGSMQDVLEPDAMGSEANMTSVMPSALRPPAKKVEEEPTSRPLCTRESMRPDQETPCGGIPDSGTTALAMPAGHVAAVASAICDTWERCSKNFTALGKAKKAAEDAAAKVFGINPYELPEYTKADVLAVVLADCANFGEDIADIMAELPDIQVQVSDGMQGNTVNLAIPGASYVFRVDMLEEDSAAGQEGLPNTGCMLGLKPMEYSTQKNGDVWILGKPLFHEYNVQYDMHDNTVGFQPTDEEPCGVCQEDKSKEHLGLLSSNTVVYTRPHVALRHRAPLKAPKHFRQPRVDTTKPL